MGEGWAPAVLNTRKEMEFVREGQRGFSDSRNYWIGGRTNVRRRSFEYPDYIPQQITLDGYIAGKTSMFHTNSDHCIYMNFKNICRSAK